MPDAADCEIRRQASQTCPDTPRKDDLQLSIGERLDRIDDPTRLLPKAQRRGCRERTKPRAPKPIHAMTVSVVPCAADDSNS